jgi:hypothetical protein
MHYELISEGNNCFSGISHAEEPASDVYAQKKFDFKAEGNQVAETRL